MRAALPAFLLTCTLHCQVPDGYLVVSSASGSAILQGPGGLFLLDPRTPGAPIPVQGLTAELIGNPNWQFSGAQAVAVRPDDGMIVVGEIANYGVPVNLHHILLAGSTAVLDVRTQVGVGSTGGSPGIIDLALLPDGSTLIAVSALFNGPPLHGASLAIVDRQGGVTPVPTPPFGYDQPLALAVDPSGSTAYLVVAPIQPTAVHLYAVTLPNGPAQLLGTYSPTITGLTFDGVGRLIASSDLGLYRIDLGTGALTPLVGLTSFPAGIASELATGGFAIVRNGFFGAPSGVDHIDSALVTQTLSTGVPGFLTDVAILANPRSYGSGTPGTATYRWQTMPAPGGLPHAGNSSFGLQVVAQGGPLAFGAVVASFGTGSATLFGVDVLLDQPSAFPLAVLPANGLLTLPIPRTAPIGLTFFVQSFHADTGGPAGVASTPGQRIQIMP